MKAGKKDLTPEKENVSGSSKVKAIRSEAAGEFPIVGIGASAGGLEALEQFFANIPKGNGMAFIVIQHLDPTHKGIMPELLQRITPMKVLQSSDSLKVQANCVYVIPPNKSLTILNGVLYLLDPVESRGLRLPIDIFFRSLADDMQDKSIGIILSGMGSDGSLGLKAIKEKNGIVLVQAPASAKFDGMPRSAIDAVIPDIVAPADELPAKLISFLKYIPVAKAEPELDDKSTTSLDKIIILLRQQSGHDFSMYKKNTLMRRIERRKGVHLIEKISSYVRLCQENSDEIEILFKELLIGVTSFFRDPEVWKTMKDEIFPMLLNELPNRYLLRAWVPACSTGEEAYSLAIVFKEAMEHITTKDKHLSLLIFATDLDKDAIEIARRGVFNANILADVSPERINRFFVEDGEGFRVNNSIREMVVFAPQNVIKDPPFTKLDILTCRNMLIYMESELQKKLTTLFHYSLNPGGILLLGTAETLGTQDEGFTSLNSKLKLYRRSAPVVTNELVDFPSSFHRELPESKKVTAQKRVEDIQVLTDQVLLQRFSPASVLVNERGDILYITGRTGKYLEPAAGKANMNIYAMIREGLNQELTGAMRKASQSFDPVILRNIKTGTNGGTQYVDMTVQHLDKPEGLRGMFLILFADVQPVLIKDNTYPEKGKTYSASAMTDLELALQRSIEDLQSTREEMQTSQEELKSTNEELQSTNEELQSTNEELTTSKEEMQSLNEELQTVNVELQSKVSDFLQANDDMKNLLNSTEIASLFLDKELNIRRFTDEATRVFKLRSSDIGRPFTDQVSELKYPEIETHARKVLKTLIPVEKQIETTDGRWFNIRIMPYRKLTDFIDGLVMTFTNITELKKLELKIQEANEILLLNKKALTISETRFRRLFETSKDGILLLNAESGMITEVNPYLIEMLGYTRDQIIKKTIWEIGFFNDLVANKDKFLELQQKEFVRYENLPLEAADGRKIEVEFISSIYSVENIKVIQCQIRELLACCNKNAD
jgi:two-component system CheB/CheR fusion protein